MVDAMVAHPEVGAARVLLIEDDRDIAHLFARGLKHYGHDVSIATDGASGLERAIETDADIVLLDLRLPRVDGIELLRQLRTRRPELAVAILTNHSDPELSARARDLGAVGYLIKSRVTPAIVAGAIRRWLAAADA
jgi:DNA-binding response OmpR family regulator